MSVVHVRGLIACLAVSLTGCSPDTPKQGVGSVGTSPKTSSAGNAAAGLGSGIAGQLGAAGLGSPTIGTGTPAAAGRGVAPVSSGVGTPVLQPMAAGIGAAPAAAAGRSAVGTMTAAIGGGMAPAPAGGNMPPPMGACTGPALPPIADYGAKGPFHTRVVTNTGPGGSYTMFRPTELGAKGFLHPPTTWGNGVTTTPDLYDALLNTVASHGFVVIASNNTAVTAQDVRSGLEWLLMQNDVAGDFQGKLAVNCAVAIGYSMGGGAAVGAAAHPNVIATVSLHGLQGAASQLHGPLLLVTSTNDGFVTKAGFVKPNYDGSTKVPTIMATLNVPGADADFSGHLIPIGDSGPERAPMIAWLRLFVYGDAAAKPWFYGADCKLCKDPWLDIQRKNANWD
jgi:hypothetical protein